MKLQALLVLLAVAIPGAARAEARCEPRDLKCVANRYADALSAELRATSLMLVFDDGETAMTPLERKRLGAVAADWHVHGSATITVAACSTDAPLAAQRAERVREQLVRAGVDPAHVVIGAPAHHAHGADHVELAISAPAHARRFAVR